MKKMKLLRSISGAGDCFIKFKEGKEILCTVDFSTKYIKKMRKKYNMSLNFRNTQTILVFSYDDNRFITIKPYEVVMTTPLAKILNNARG